MSETMKGVAFTGQDTVRVGFLGVGGRGRSLLRNVLAVDGAVVTALYDIREESVLKARQMVEDAGQPTPAVFTDPENGYRDLCARSDVDLVYVAGPWDWHVPHAVCAMEQGKHVAVEVPAATTLEDCWRLVETSEQTRRHCVMLENCCYGHTELLVRNMVRDGLLGEILHGEAAYIHDLRSILLADHGEGLWRRFPHTQREGNLYPTHGLGPVAQYMGIHQGDRFDYLVSMSSPSRGLGLYRDRVTSADDPKRGEVYPCGDINTSLIKTVQGRTIVLQHDVVSPRPYDRINLISGTKGTFRDYPPRLFLDGQEGGHDWQSLDTFREKYEDPLWKQVGELARKLGGHGGMDFLMNYRLIQCFREGLPPDMDVYDAAAWSAPGPLSDQSIAQRSAPVPFPDFTRGNWG
ncbi:MAG: Gfo/Idh/MocA family oxidoreductase [Armatimonadaceae bacterium]